MSESYDEHQAALADAIGKVAGAAMVTHYVVVAAVIYPDGGEETTHLITSPGLPLWMAHGLLSYEAAATVPQPFYDYSDGEGEA